MTLTDEQKRVLTLLAGCPDGATTYNLCRRHGVSAKLIYDLVMVDLVTVRRQNVHSNCGTVSVDVHRVRITDTGRQALNGGGES